MEVAWVTLEEVLQVAVTASKKAGDIRQKNSGGADVVEKKSTSRDLLTLIDPQCEKVGQVPFLKEQTDMNESIP